MLGFNMRNKLGIESQPDQDETQVEQPGMPAAAPSQKAAPQGGSKLDPVVRKNWIEIQKKHTVPVNAIGVKINPKDERIFKIWKAEGIDAYVKT
jgi:hypothetical protein